MFSGYVDGGYFRIFCVQQSDEKTFITIAIIITIIATIAGPR